MLRYLHIASWVAFTLASGITLVLAAAYLYLNPQIPATESFSDVHIKAPLRIYSEDDKLMQEFGERLIPITYDEIPERFKRALLDTEDKRFYEHSGIDLITVANATAQLVLNQGDIQTGASTITMQLVKNVSGDTQVRFIRKFKEMLQALKIERELTKQEILTLYLNIIPFGKHAYGIQAASNTYYGKNIDELSLAQMAMLAGIPKAPEAGNPINGPDRAFDRRNLVLRRMLDQKSITEEEYQAAIAEPITAEVHSRQIDLLSPYVSEMVRKYLLSEYGRDAYSAGLVVHTTIHSEKQRAAEKALEKKLVEYDHRHGYRGPETRQIQGTDQYLAAPEYGYPNSWLETLEQKAVVGTQYPAIVIATSEKQLEVLTRDHGVLTIEWENMKWARPYLSVDRRGASPRQAEDIAGVGDLIRITPVEEGTWALGQIPDISGALVALDPKDGAIRSLVGGYDFGYNQFNNATQARRQPGSNFKPFFYAGALESGMTAATIYNDAPIVLPGGELEEKYRPKNSGDKFYGNIRLREALYRSINLVSLRVILDFGPDNALEYVRRFGFDTSSFPRNVQLAFGGGTIALTPIEVATAYAAFANGGFKVDPYLVKRVSSINDDTMFESEPTVACEAEKCGTAKQAVRIIEPRVAYIMDSILSDTIMRGTGRKAYREMERKDLRGKTGTTNDADIWFSGYTPDLVATAWAGFDNNGPVGSREWGSTTPLETWVEFMATALPPESESTELARPEGMVAVRIDPDTGYRAEPTDPDAVFEYFREEYAPSQGLARKEDDRSEVLTDIF